MQTPRREQEQAAHFIQATRDERAVLRIHVASLRDFFYSFVRRTTESLVTSMRIFFLLGSSGVVIAVGLACNSPTSTPSACTVNSNATAAVVTMVWRARPDSMRVLVQGAATIRAACAYVDTQSGPHIMVGRIVRGAGVDPRVPFHYLPDSIALVDAAIELCDSGLLRTPADVDAYFLGSTGRADAPSAPYCPWGAPPVLVEPAA